MHHIRVAHGVFLAFDAESAGFADGFFGFEFGEVGDGVGFGADESSFEVGVYGAGGLWGGGALFDGPGSDFFGACGVEGLEAEESVEGVCDGVEGGFFEAEVLEHFVAVVLVEVGEFGLDFGADGDALHGFVGCALFDGLCEGVGSCDVAFVDVGDVEDAFGGHEAEASDGGAFVG